MKLGDFLKALTNGAQIKVTLIDRDTSSSIAALMADGYESLEDEIESREVKKWEIKNASAIEIVLGDVLTDSTDPSNP